MIKIEKDQVVGWEAAIRGMRNPMNSWGKSDSIYCQNFECCSECDHSVDWECQAATNNISFDIGPNDHELMMKLAKAGSVHAKYRRMIVVYADITAPLYWWKEFDTYKVGTVSNSCSTMHKIAEKKFTLDDFSNDRMYNDTAEILYDIVDELNGWREMYLESKKNMDWWQMIQLLPSSYNQKRTIMMNYEVLYDIYSSRKDHRLDEWRNFCEWIEKLPYSEVITLKNSRG